MVSGVDDGARTHDRRDHNPELYQLSYVHHYLRSTEAACIASLNSGRIGWRRGIIRSQPGRWEGGMQGNPNPETGKRHARPMHWHWRWH